MGQSSHVRIAVASLFIAPVNNGLRHFEQESESPSMICVAATGRHTDCSQVSEAAFFCHQLQNPTMSKVSGCP